jgi:hypothetical protein
MQIKRHVKDDVKKNDFPIYLKCFHKINLLPFLEIAQKGEHNPPHLGGKTPMPTLKRSKRGSKQNYQHLTLITFNKEGDVPIGI